MFNNLNLNIKNYVEDSPKFEKLDWWDLPDSVNLSLNRFPKDVKKLGNFVTVRRLKNSNQKENITKNITHIKKETFGNKRFKIKFPILLNNKEYACLYALMISEGSHRTEFSLNVPEEEFHLLFKDCIKNLISEDAMNFIKCDYNKGVLRSRSPARVRYLIPIPPKIPFIILNNKDLARDYLKIAFEAEGSPIFNKKQHKRYIKLSRYVDITSFITKENLPLKKRLYWGTIKKEYPVLFERIKNYPPKILEGEQILLKIHFDIDSKLQLEAIRNNKTGLRCGKIAARWVLLIYANNIDKFIKEISFISERKADKLKEMSKIRGNRPQYYTLNLVKKISDAKGYFYRRDFVKEMNKLGYKNPSCYLWRYYNNGIIERIKKGYYKILF